MEPIAIIGTGCRFPGASSTPARLWELLHAPRDVASKVPSERFNIDGFYHPDGGHHGTTNAQESYFLTENVRGFDASFFNISASEAECIDPQQRILLETVYESLEAAGLRLEDLQGSKTGVFCGVMCDDYGHIMMRDIETVPRYAATGTARSIVSNRLSYFFDWHGPSMTIDTACSSSLVAVHLASKALRDGDCRVAVAAGTNLILGPNMYITESKLNMLSPAGRSRMWDAQADGYARGEGVAAVVLKRLSDAIADGDPIECIVRATEINQDGRSMGITMPSSHAQTELIRSTYAKAGLDVVADRCQYFEAHGTGTPAGDPQEANAIHDAFFPSEEEGAEMHVGSVKTVIGHTEGTAGLAGLIKASLSLQHRVIVPNLHFQRLNPKIEPYYSHLHIPTKALPWPELPAGVPRRASVNSFGFGGTNAHAILESYEAISLPRNFSSIPVVLPFTFSAATEKTLGSVLESYQQFLQSNPQADPVDLAWSLFRRRAAFLHRVTLWAPSIESLSSKIEAEIASRKANNPSTIKSRTTSGPKTILGVFTGQGAQWPEMGLDLITASPEARACFDALQASLDALPAQYRPDYSLLGELSAPKSSSRLHQAAISQPLCTAVQIVLVNFLRSLGIEFAAVVGHSSGEIGAAYAAGFLTASEAIRIAHLRGVFAKLAGANGQPGAMLAAGMSMEEAQALCAAREFAGRVTVAASNSPSSVTLSGDADAIKEVEKLLKDQDKFARALKVDTAYHSHHMLPCSQSYIQALAACNIRPGKATSSKWFSSVYDGQEMTSSHSTVLKADYWNKNMVNAVLFSQALTKAIKSASFDMIVEIGPHPALKGPALQTISDLLEGSSEIPYAGLLKRGSSGIEAFAEAIGAFWTYLGAESSNVESYVRQFDKSRQFTFVRGLPSYPFDRTQSYWAESRQSKALTNRTIRPNQVLGAPSPEAGEGEWRWRNFLRREEIDWLDGHKVQSQTVFPATGYVAMALEAAAIIAGQRSIRLVEIEDLIIKQAIAISDDSVGVETLFTVQNISSESDLLSGEFTCFANFGGTLRRCVSGRMMVTFGSQDSMMLPPRMSEAQGMTSVNLDSFYSYLSKLGYGYTGLFRGITSLLRQKDTSTGLIQNACLVDSSSPLLLHPALMDTMLQTLLACVGMPGDGALYTLHIPTKIGRIAINPQFCGPRAVALGENLAFDAAVTKFDATGVRGDADLFDKDGNGILQMESVEVAPLMAPTAADDRLLFSKLVWGGLHPDAALAYSAPSPNQVSKFDLLERTALLYMKDMQDKLTEEDRANVDWHRSRVVSWVDRVLSMARAGTHPICRPEWLEDSLERVSPLLESVADDKDDIDIAVMHVVGKNILRFVRGETTILEELRRDNLLDRLYKESDDMAAFNAQLGDVADQIAFRYPRMKILEIGGGTGSATRAVINRIGRNYHSYTFTDISVGFFEEAQEAFADHADRFIYKALDVERDPLEQGFEKGEYDMIVAANVLHATKSMKTTMTNVRSLLKPGGHLVLLEGTNLDVLRTTFVFSGFEGWWLGEPDGRLWGPMMNEREWDTLLKNVGFSGVDTITPEHEVGVRAFSVVVSQAVDDQIRYLRDPLNSTVTEPKHNDLFIIGGATERTSSLVAELQEKLQPFFRRLIRSETLESVEPHNSSMATVLNLTDLDFPCFKDFTSDRLDALKGLVDASRNFLWITAGSDGENPYQSMGKGMLRCLGFENPHSRYQHLNIADWSAVTAPLLATTLLRLAGPDFDNDYNLPAATWSIEPEMRLENGVTTIPRVKPDASRNERYMANRRAIYDTVDLQESNVQVTLSGDSYDLVPSSQPQAGSTRIRVTHSTLTAVRVKGAFLHLVIGHDVETGAHLLALSSEHASVISTPTCWAVPCDVPETDAQEFLVATISALAAIDLTGLATPGSALLVHEANPVLRTAISLQASSSGIRPFFTTSKPENRSDGVIFLHGMSSTRALADQLPKGVSATIRFDTESDSVFNRVESLLPASTLRERVSSLHQKSSHVSKSCEVREVGETLHQARLLAAEVASGNMEIDTMDIRDLPGSSADVNGLKLVNWANAADVPVMVQPASSQLTLSGDKTYLLIGMTGDLGRSVCQWMVSKGARNIVLASRRPKIEQWWIDTMAKAGAKVVPMVMDVTSKESILHVDRTIRAELPPVGGVVNGAMVLSDHLFADISLDTMQSIFRPKVEGSIFLDELYANHDLDFFILFGSMAGPMGNRGQSAYSAATTFMSSIIQGRRARGLVGSIINPGEISGVGYVARLAHLLSDALADSFGSLALSERDLHELFAEGILAGRRESGHSPELIAGVAACTPSEQPNIIWYPNPRAWHFVNHFRSTTSRNTTSDAVPVKVQLESASSLREAAEIVENGFIAKLRNKLQLSEEDTLTRENLLVELGVDSLVAVDLRTWFVKELNVDMPILKLLGGSSIGELVDDAISKLPETLLAHISDDSGETTAVESNEQQQQQRQADDSSSPATPDRVFTPAQASTPERVSTPATEETSDGVVLRSKFNPLTAADFVRLRAASMSSGSVYASSQTDDDSISSFEISSFDNNEIVPYYEKIERLSFSQSRYWFLNQYLEDKSAYNVSFLFSFTTLPRIEDLQAAVRTVGMRHETLRTCYIMAGGENNEPYQAITPTSRLELEICHVNDEMEAQEQYARIRDHVYDLDNGEVARIRLVITPSNTQYLIMGYHHMAMDAASFEVFLMELSRAYTHQPLPPVSRQYTDYAAAQRDAYECGDMQKELAYWRKEFQTTPDPIPLLPMAKTRSRQVLKEYALEELQCKVGASTMRKIKDACKKSRATPFHFFLAAVRVFLARLTEADDFCIGVADANRLDPANQNTIGFLLNLLPVRFTSTSTQQSFKQILSNTREKALGALRHSKLPFDKMLDDLGVTRSTAYSPLFQVLVDWQPRSGGSRKFADITTETVDMQPGKTGYDLTLLITDSDNGESTINFRLQKSLYSRSGAELVARSFVNLVESFAMDFDRNAYEAPLYPKSDLQHAIGLGAGPSMAAQWPSTISKRIDQVAEHHANDIAVKDPSGRAFTYSQLMNRVDIVASALVEAGVQSGSRVCLFQHPTAEWVSCMLATWKLNAVYVPLDLRNPVPRLAAMVQDCQPQVILCHDESKADVTGLNSPSKVINVSELSFDDKVAPVENKSSAESAAAILYSSGSTGRPKGIQLGHLGLVNNMEGLCMRWKVGAETVLQQGAMTFDHSLDQLLVGLSNGGRLIVVPRSMRGDPLSLSKLMVEEKVTYTKATPAEYLMWLRYASDVLRNNDNWRFAFLGGEHVTTSLVDGFRDLGLPNLHLFNSYGPAEISIASHKGEIDYNAPRPSAGNVYPAGYSLPNYTTYIVDKDMKPVPQGVSGEILIGGAGPCKGYVNLDSLTQEKFIVNPLVSAEYRSQGWTTAYRTFDRGHLLTDGSLVIEGRLDGDTQVKLRGIRMELEEIENAILETSKGVLINTIVSRREEGDNQFLVAHVTFASHFQGDKDHFLKQLRGNLPLPQYMWPSIAIPVDELPLNVHGKVDRKAVNAFPLPKRSMSSGTSGADLTEAESLMRDVWEKVLDDGLTDLSNVNSETNFFLVGGNSVLLVKLQATIKETMGVSIPLAELFEASTLGGMAEKAQAIQPTTVINWEQETSVDELIEFAQYSQEHSPKDQDLTVILTGATGFLGKRILNLLESNPAVSRIHAVAVRSNSNRTLDASSSKLVVHHGDLSAPLLGLDDDTFTSLAAEVDLVIHCGANRSFWDAYPVLRGSNVTGTRSLIALASQKRAPIHFMSSGGVADITDVPPTDGSDGYIASKWASERLLRNATEKIGISTIIHRPVQADNLQPPSDALVNELNDVIQRIRAVPIEGSWNGTFTLMPADQMAEQVVGSALTGTERCDVTIQQHVATVQLRMEEVMKINDLATPGTFDGFERLPAVKWLGRAKREGGFGWFVAAHNAVMGNGDVSMASRR